ncbi:MAG: glycosyltransferase [Nocardioides sp.]
MRSEVQDWFRSRTYTSRQPDRYRLAELKGDTRLSVVLPARDEASTIGAIVTSLRKELVEAVPLLDEIVVIDSGSMDLTSRVAADAGAQVYPQRDILPETGDRPGKGEALWKSLHVTTGDVVAFIDADLHDFDPQFAVGLLVSLL